MKSFRVAVLVNLFIDGKKTDERSLTSFNHREPKDGSPKKNVGKSRVNLRRNFGLSGGDQSHNDGDREDKEARSIEILEHGNIKIVCLVDIIRIGR